MQDLVWKENVGPFIKELLRNSRQKHQSINLNIRPFRTWDSVGLDGFYAHKAGAANTVPLSTMVFVKLVNMCCHSKEKKDTKMHQCIASHMHQYIVLICVYIHIRICMFPTILHTNRFDLSVILLSHMQCKKIWWQLLMAEKICWSSIQMN